jgi:hypothetical protein
LPPWKFSVFGEERNVGRAKGRKWQKAERHKSHRWRERADTHLRSACRLAGCSVMALTVSYNYTFVDFTPEFSGEEFKQTRIGPISVNLPASFGEIHNHSRVGLTFPRHRLMLYEYKLPTPCLPVGYGNFF